jgi:predicted amidohydrolase
VTWNVNGIRVTPLVCYDLRFPEPFRVAAPETDLYIVIANWPDKRRAHWQTLLRARAIENVAYVAGVNRVGDGDGHHYAGDSALISPWGETIVSAAEEETVLLANVAARVEETAPGSCSSGRGDPRPIAVIGARRH